jgi:TonB family protein
MSLTTKGAAGFHGRALRLAPLALLPALTPCPARAAIQETKPSPAAVVVAETKSSDIKIAGQDVAGPTRRKYVAPEYPLDAAAQGIRGIVIVEVLVGEDGKVLSARVTRSIPGLDEAAIAAVKLWEYEPAKVAGKPVKVQLSQSITFALRLPELSRGPGIPELKSGGTPPPPPPLEKPEFASVAVTLGAQGEVKEAAVIDGHPAVGDALLRAVRSWRFNLPENAVPPSFTIRGEWSAGTTPAVTLRAFAAKTAQAQPAPPAAGSPAPSLPAQSAGSPTSSSSAAAATPPQGAPVPPVETEVLTARPEPQVKEQGVSSVNDVQLGDNIPDLVRGRRPVWPPLARLGNAVGDVTVRFSVDIAGKATVYTADGPDLLKSAAEQAVATWVFRRTAIDRLNLVATFRYTPERASAKIDRVSQ